MKTHSIKCEAIEVRTDSGVCVGLAKTTQGETFILDGRTPESPGICTNALCALSNAAFIMMSSEDKLTKRDGYIDRVCPHGIVTFRLSRTDVFKNESFTKK